MKLRRMETRNTLCSYALYFTVPCLGRLHEDRVATGSHTRDGIMLVSCTEFTDGIRVCVVYKAKTTSIFTTTDTAVNNKCKCRYNVKRQAVKTSAEAQ